MAAMSAASLRAVNRACFSLPPRVGSTTSSLVLRTSALSSRPLRHPVASPLSLQLRLQSTRPPDAPKPGPGQQPGAPPSQPPPPPPLSKTQFFIRLLSVRGFFSSLTPRGLKKLYHQSPVELIAALVVLASLLGIVVYITKVCIEYFYARQFTKYPAPIAKSLRRALYYTNIKSEPALARKWYKRALEQCNEHGLDPYSDDVLGIRIQTAAWLEKIGNYPGAITVLESVWRDCTSWVTAMDKGIADGTVDKLGRVPAVAKPETESKGEEEEIPENLWAKRSRLLAKAVGTSTKLGELYGDGHVNDSENSQTKLIWAVETALSEARRRTSEGVKPDEGKWLSPEEFGGAMESLAIHYESKQQFQLAVPLLFQALRLCESPCHRPTIMNNLAVAFAQHPVLPPSTEKLPEGGHENPDAAAIMKGMPTTRPDLLEAAWNWARNAKTHAKEVEASQRTPECDEACAVALSNMADIAALRNNPKQARRLFEECIDLSKKIGFEQGVSQAQNGLRTLGADGN
ncbi:TPR domain-containing protein [Plectosphaerella cucumerina]|uniref:TPR domain-containing protein n=1 Tax=Plectosphaerella cucumerina TaxID=40658 RepID=A0A8K0TBC4_9PEZI|nr:TPR domain-containing protein [Plectosphaerella cucumerina]